MKITLDIDTSDSKALALLNYIRTLDFISIGEKGGTITPEQKKAIDVGIEQLRKGNGILHSEVKKDTKKRYPQLF
jgi:hypothetical protein